MNSVFPFLFLSLLLLTAVVGTTQYLKHSRRKNLRGKSGVPQVHGVAARSLQSEKMRISQINREKGVIGEEGIAKVLEDLAREYGLVVLHDLSIPGQKANIDHILIQSNAVFVIDAKNYLGKVNVKKDSKGKFQLYVGRNKRTELATKLKTYAEKVENHLSSTGNMVKVVPLLAFYRAEFHPNSKYQIDGVMVNVSGIENELLRFDSRKGNDFDIRMLAEKILEEFPFKDY